jgi:Secretion system C-terminal sorting domain/HmuY protein
MFKTIHVFSIILCLLVLDLSAQTIRTMSTGAGYRKQSFIKLSDGAEKQVDDTSWDIAFTVYGQQDAGIHVNESAGSSMGQALTGVTLFDAKTTDFGAILESANYTPETKLLNDEASWAYGAFNSGRVTTSPFDYGWGAYVPTSQSVVGQKVFVIKLRNNTYKKIQIQNLIGLTYTFRYADLNGANERTASIKKSDFAGRTLAYYSIQNNSTTEVEPTSGFDLMYCRYFAPIFDPASGTTIEYQLTGVLSGRGVQVAKAVGVAQAVPNLALYKDSLKTRLDVIGNDWKAFTGASWVVPSDVAYYVKAKDNHIYHMYYIDFEGATTGTAVYEIRDLGLVSSVITPNSPVSTLDVYPNPAVQDAQVVFTTTSATELQLQVLDMTGRMVQQRNISSTSGFQTERLDVANLAGGVYQVVLRSTNGVANTKLIVNR